MAGFVAPAASAARPSRAGRNSRIEGRCLQLLVECGNGSAVMRKRWRGAQRRWLRKRKVGWRREEVVGAGRGYRVRRVLGKRASR
jgi:hypothetical protein